MISCPPVLRAIWMTNDFLSVIKAPSWSEASQHSVQPVYWCAAYFPTAPPVQQQEEQMDCAAETLDPSDDATLSQVNKWCHSDRVMTGQQSWRYNDQCLTRCVLANSKWRGGFEWGRKGQTEGRTTQSQEKGEHSVFFSLICWGYCLGIL